jgi:4-alpha-glucanotransferase
VGAPPDAFNTRGQNWGLPPLNPWRLRAAGYQPFIETIRAGLRHAGGLRLDHVMGLFRLFWIPEGADPARGAYVRYPAGDLLDILALESVRSGAVVVGEDLGTVEPEVRDELAARGLLSYRLLWFEDTEPAAWPRQALAAVTTHDLPTVAGLWTGADLERLRALGLGPNEQGTIAIRERLRRWAGLAAGASAAEAVTAAHRLLATAPSMLLAATLEDALGVVERPNVPGTTPGHHANWSLALPRTLEELEADALTRHIATLLRR